MKVEVKTYSQLKVGDKIERYQGEMLTDIGIVSWVGSEGFEIRKEGSYTFRGSLGGSGTYYIIKNELEGAVDL